MAQTKYISEALTVAKLTRQGEDDMAAYIANIALETIWNAYDWRESIATLPPFYLIPAEQEFGLPYYAVPSDFRGLREVYCTQTSTNPPNRVPINVMHDIRLTASEGWIRDIGYESSSQKFRVFPRVPNNIGSTDYIIEGTYKKRAPQVTASSLQSTLIPWDDEYFNTFVLSLKWSAAEVNDNPRADRLYQQLGISVDKMAAREGLDLGDPSIAPSEPLAIPKGYYQWWLGI